MSIDERIEALTVNLELAHRDIQDLRGAMDSMKGIVDKLVIAGQQDGENIRGLVRVAELHHERLERLENQ